MSIAVYPGSFDPITKGHLDVIRRISPLFATVIVAVLHNPEKHGLFTVDEREELIRRTVRQSNVQVTHFSGLLSQYVQAERIDVIIRGLRDVGDFEGEMKLAAMNRMQVANAETLFVPTDPAYVFVSSSLIKQIAMYGGDVSPFVTENVAVALHQKYRGSESSR